MDITNDVMDLMNLKRLRIKLGSLVVTASKAAAAGDLSKVRKTKKDLEDLLKKHQILGLLSAEEINLIQEAVNLVAELERCAEKKKKEGEEYEKEKLEAEERITEIRRETIEKLKEQLIEATYVVLGESNLDVLIKQQEEEIARLRSEIQGLKSYYQELEEERRKSHDLIEKYNASIDVLGRQIFLENYIDKLIEHDPSKSRKYWEDRIGGWLVDPKTENANDIFAKIADDLGESAADMHQDAVDLGLGDLIKEFDRDIEERKKEKEKDQELAAQQESVAQQIKSKEEELVTREAVVEDLKQQKAALEKGVGIETERTEETQASETERGQAPEKRGQTPEGQTPEGQISEDQPASPAPRNTSVKFPPWGNGKKPVSTEQEQQEGPGPNKP